LRNRWVTTTSTTNTSAYRICIAPKIRLMGKVAACGGIERIWIKINLLRYLIHIDYGQSYDDTANTKIIIYARRIWLCLVSVGMRQQHNAETVKRLSVRPSAVRLGTFFLPGIFLLFLVAKLQNESFVIFNKHGWEETVPGGDNMEKIIQDFSGIIDLSGQIDLIINGFGVR